MPSRYHNHRRRAQMKGRPGTFWGEPASHLTSQTSRMQPRPRTECENKEKRMGTKNEGENLPGFAFLSKSDALSISEDSGNKNPISTDTSSVFDISHGRFQWSLGRTAPNSHFRSNLISCFSKLVEVFNLTKDNTSPNELRTAVSVEALANMIKMQEARTVPVLNTAMQELLSAIYSDEDAANNANSIEKSKKRIPYFQLYHATKQNNRELLDRNCVLRSQVENVENSSKKRTGSIDSIVSRWRHKVKRWVFMQWVLLSVEESLKKENLVQQYVRGKTIRKYKDTFKAWKHLIVEAKAKKFAEMKRFLQEADESNERLAVALQDALAKVAALEHNILERDIHDGVHRCLENIVAVLILEDATTVDGDVDLVVEV